MALYPVKNIINGDHLLRQTPNFAIVRIPEEADALKLFNLLLNNGFAEVSFVKEIRENAFLPAAGPSVAPSETGNSPQEVEEAGARASTTPIVVDDDLGLVQSSPSGSGIANQGPASGAIPSPIPFVARPRGARATTGDDPAMYAICRLCQNKIMSSRLSNLTNHVRRHASLKQFQCVHCVYSHNEMAKVRLHMQHNHKDQNSQPFDALSPEMQSQWDALMDQCFPGHLKASSESGAVEDLTVAVKEEGKGDEAVAYSCLQCGQRISSKHLVDHLEKEHKDDCVPYSCGECGYLNAEQWKVRLHITLKHSEQAAEVSVKTLETGSNLYVFLHKYFPETPADEEEDKMLAQFQSMAQKEERSASPITSDGSRAQSVEGDTNGHIRCELCQKQMPNNRSLSSLMNHAKRHYHVKQYQCTECVYTSSEAAHVRTHMAIRHPSVGAKPIDNNCETLQNAWIDVMRKCFPALIAKIDQFRFKHSRSVGDMKEEDLEGNLTGKIGRGKRKSVLRTITSSSPQRKSTKIENGSGCTEAMPS